MSKTHTKRIWFIAVTFTSLGLIGMVLWHHGALCPCVLPQFQGQGWDISAIPIGKALNGKMITVDVLVGAGQGSAFVWSGFLWLIGAIATRWLLGWGDLAVPTRAIRLLGLAGGMFQFLGALIFLFAISGLLSSLSGKAEIEVLALTFGQALRSTFSGLTTFGLGNLMTLIFLKLSLESERMSVTSKKRRMVTSLSFVPLTIAAVALVSALAQIPLQDPAKSSVLAAIFVGFALPLVVGSIPLLVSTRLIPKTFPTTTN